MTEKRKKKKKKKKKKTQHMKPPTHKQMVVGKLFWGLVWEKASTSFYRAHSGVLENYSGILKNGVQGPANYSVGHVKLLS